MLQSIYVYNNVKSGVEFMFSCFKFYYVLCFKYFTNNYLII